MTPASTTSPRYLIPCAERRYSKVQTGKPSRQHDTADKRREGIASEVEGFNDRARRAVRDEELHDSVALFTEKAVGARNAVLHALPEAPQLRERAYRIKRRPWRTSTATWSRWPTG
jgi:hypothetical protein